MTLCLAFLTLLAVLFFATHPDALGAAFVIGGALVWYGVKVTFAQPKRRSRSRSRSRRYGGPHSPHAAPHTSRDVRGRTRTRRRKAQLEGT